jgi:ABC-type transport system involved in multi-copper enzyme maturation permease subunit
MSGAACRPRFDLLVRGELRKLALQRSSWLLMALWVVLAAVAGLVLSTSSGIWRSEAAYRATLQTDPAYWVHGVVVVGGMIVRVVEGALLLIAAARLVGTEYSAGTIRVVLARGVGRLRLLAAKLAALVSFGLAVTAGFLALAAAFVLVMIATQGASPARVISIMPGSAWQDVGIHVLAILISAGVCVLIGVAGAAVGRSLPLAMVVAVGYFPLDNLLAGGRDYNVYQLGPNLNVMAETLGHMRESLFTRPAQPVDVTHSLVVVGVYCAVFLLAAVIPTWRRDVQE